MKATSESTLSPDHRNHLTRRAALSGAASVGALALPAALLTAAPAGAGIPAGNDPHVGWWAELVEVRAEQDAAADYDDDLIDRESELEDLISTTAPTTPEGMAIVAAMIVAGHERVYPNGVGLSGIEKEDKAGGRSPGMSSLRRPPTCCGAQGWRAERWRPFTS